MAQPKDPLESLYPQYGDLFTLAGDKTIYRNQVWNVGMDAAAATEAFRKIQKSLESIATLSRALDNLPAPLPEPNWATDP